MGVLPLRSWPKPSVALARKLSHAALAKRLGSYATLAELRVQTLQCAETRSGREVCEPCCPAFQWAA